MAYGLIDIDDVVVGTEGDDFKNLKVITEKRRVFYCSECNGSLEGKPTECPHCGSKILKIVDNVEKRKEAEVKRLVDAHTRIEYLMEKDSNETVKEYLGHAYDELTEKIRSIQEEFKTM